jgi:hypothetical protein
MGPPARPTDAFVTEPTNRTPPGEEVGFLQRLWEAKGFVLRAWAVFVLSAAALIHVLIWARPFTDTTLSRWIAHVSAATLRLLGAEAEVHGTVIASSLGTLEIIRECTGVYPTALFIAAVVAYPCSCAKKAGGVLVGILAWKRA